MWRDKQDRMGEPNTNLYVTPLTKVQVREAADWYQRVGNAC